MINTIGLAFSEFLTSFTCALAAAGQYWFIADKKETLKLASKVGLLLFAFFWTGLAIDSGHLLFARETYSQNPLLYAIASLACINLLAILNNLPRHKNKSGIPKSVTFTTISAAAFFFQF